MKHDELNEDLPSPIRVLVVAGTGLVRAELRSAFDEDFEVAPAADAPAAAELAKESPHAAIVVADDLYNCSMEDVITRIRLASPACHRVAVLVLSAHGTLNDLSAPFHWGADDVASWPLEPDMFRARVRSLVRVAVLEAAMARLAGGDDVGADELRRAVGVAVHLVNNAVAGISGRAQLATLTGAIDEAGLIPICLSEARKMSLVLGALHRLGESMAPRDDDTEELEALVAASRPVGA